MPTFNVGDSVLCVTDDGCMRIHRGNVYNVTEVSLPSGEDWCTETGHTSVFPHEHRPEQLLELADINGQNVGVWFSCRFQPNPEQFVVGDVVVCVNPIDGSLDESYTYTVTQVYSREEVRCEVCHRIGEYKIRVDGAPGRFFACRFSKQGTQIDTTERILKFLNEKFPGVNVSIVDAATYPFNQVDVLSDGLPEGINVFVNARPSHVERKLCRRTKYFSDTTDGFIATNIPLAPPASHRLSWCHVWKLSKPKTISVLFAFDVKPPVAWKFVQSGLNSLYTEYNEYFVDAYSLYIKAKQQTASQRTRQLKSDLEYEKGQADGFEQALEECRKRVKNCEYILAKNKNDLDESKLKREWEKIAKHKQLVNVFIKDRAVIADTIPIEIGPLHDGSIRLMGQYRITIPFGSNGMPTIKRSPLSQPSPSDPLDFIHPHIRASGSVCWGNMQEMLSVYVASDETKMLIDSVLIFLHSYNGADAYTPITNWPIKEGCAIDVSKLCKLHEACPCGQPGGYNRVGHEACRMRRTLAGQPIYIQECTCDQD